MQGFPCMNLVFWAFSGVLRCRGTSSSRACATSLTTTWPQKRTVFYNILRRFPLERSKRNDAEMREAIGGLVWGAGMSVGQSSRGLPSPQINAGISFLFLLMPVALRSFVLPAGFEANACKADTLRYSDDPLCGFLGCACIRMQVQIIAVCGPFSQLNIVGATPAVAPQWYRLIQLRKVARCADRSAESLFSGEYRVVLSPS